MRKIVAVILTSIKNVYFTAWLYLFPSLFQYEFVCNLKSGVYSI